MPKFNNTPQTPKEGLLEKIPGEWTPEPAPPTPAPEKKEAAPQPKPAPVAEPKAPPAKNAPPAAPVPSAPPQQQVEKKSGGWGKFFGGCLLGSCLSPIIIVAIIIGLFSFFGPTIIQEIFPDGIPTGTDLSTGSREIRELQNAPQGVLGTFDPPRLDR